MNIRIGRYDIEINARLSNNEPQATSGSTEHVLHVLELACRDAAQLNIRDGMTGTALNYLKMASGMHDALAAHGYYD